MAFKLDPTSLDLTMNKWDVDQLKICMELDIPECQQVYLMMALPPYDKVR